MEKLYHADSKKDTQEFGHYRSARSGQVAERHATALEVGLNTLREQGAGRRAERREA